MKQTLLLFSVLAALFFCSCKKTSTSIYTIKYEAYSTSPGYFFNAAIQYANSGNTLSTDYEPLESWSKSVTLNSGDRVYFSVAQIQYVQCSYTINVYENGSLVKTATETVSNSSQQFNQGAPLSPVIDYTLK